LAVRTRNGQDLGVNVTEEVVKLIRDCEPRPHFLEVLTHLYPKRVSA
jgi:hypothetical protein